MLLILYYSLNFFFFFLVNIIILWTPELGLCFHLFADDFNIIISVELLYKQKMFWLYISQGCIVIMDILIECSNIMT